DFVRVEIASALNRNVRVIPALVEGALMPGPNDLPSDLAGLSRRNALEISNSMFRENVARLIRAIEETVGPKTAPPLLRAFQKRPSAERGHASSEPAPAPALTVARFGWQIFAAAAAFGLIQILLSQERMSYPWIPSAGRVLATGILQCAALALIWLAPGRMDRDRVLKLTLAWFGTTIFWLIANQLVLAPWVARSGPSSSLQFVESVLQVGAALVFGTAARLIVCVTWHTISILARMWLFGGLAIWLVRLIAQMPASPAITTSTVLLEVLIGSSVIWLVDQPEAKR
ncbi:MAG TPA: hypothetical protein VKX49_19540, partial [Bryobacteraceae bacterium]|nr:hypothetical protein [Bryobacteraceae bacterium]